MEAGTSGSYPFGFAWGYGGQITDTIYDFIVFVMSTACVTGTIDSKNFFGEFYGIPETKDAVCQR